jgi:ribosomal protein S18 acetylase RimI-like enzyme
MTSIAAPMVDIRTMRAVDIPFAVRLITDEGWDYSSADFERLLSYQPEGCFIASVDGVDAGMVTTTTYGEDSAFIGCLLVDPPFRGRRLGIALFEHATGHLRSAGVGSIHLEAVPRAEGLYRKLGFVQLWQSLRLLGMECRTPHSSNGYLQDKHMADMEVRLFKAKDRKEILRLDRRLTAMDRSRILKDVLGRFGKHTFVCRKNGELVGFLSGRPATRGYRLGPWMCTPDGEEVPLALLDLASRTFEGEKLFVGLPAINTVGVNILKRHGFRDGLTCSRMRWGIGGSDGDPRALFGITSAEKG